MTQLSQPERAWLAEQIAKLPTDLTPRQKELERELTRDLDQVASDITKHVQDGGGRDGLLVLLTDLVIKHRAAALDEQRERLTR